jgi:hypothetical protein
LTLIRFDFYDKNMKILRLRKHRERKDGTRTVIPILRERGRKYGPISKETVISVRRDVLVTGPHSSGKTRWLERMHEQAPGIWAKRPAVYLRSSMPLSAWGDGPEIQEWVQKRGEDWRKLKAWERTDRLIMWITENKAVLLLDDAHLLTGRKADVALRCVRSAGLVVTSAAAEGRIPITLRLAIQGRNPEKIALRSEAPYDLTAVLAVIVSVMAVAAGAWPLAAAVGGLHLLGRGARSAKQS